MSKRKKPADDIDALMASEGIGGSDDIDSLMASEGIAPIKQTMVPGARSIAEQQLSGGASDEQGGKYARATGDGEPIALDTDPRPKTTFFQRMFPGNNWTDKQKAQLRESLAQSQKTLLGAPQGESKSGDLGRGLFNAADTFAFGVPRRVMAVHPEIRPDSLAPEEMEDYRKRRPQDAALSGAAGMLANVRGPAALIDKASASVVGKVAPGLAKSAVGRTASATASGALSGGTQAALSGQDAKTGAVLGGGLSGGLTGLSEGAGALAGWLRGKGWIGKYAKAKDSGLMAQAEAEAARGELSKDPAGQFAAAGKARDKILARDEALAAQESSALTEARKPHMDKPANWEATADSLDDLATKNRLSTGGVADEGFDEDIAKLAGSIESRTTNEDLLKLRAQLQESAAFGSPNRTKEQIRAGKLYMALREGVSDPIKEADRVYSQAQLARARRNDLMLGSEDGAREVKLPDDPNAAVPPLRQAARAGDEQNMAVRLGRLGDDSVEGARANARIEELRAMNDPEINKALDELEARKAWMATRATITPDMPTNLHKAIAYPINVVKQNATALGARAVLPAAEAIKKPAAAASKRAGTASTLFQRFSGGK